LSAADNLPETHLIAQLSAVFYQQMLPDSIDREGVQTGLLVRIGTLAPGH
jgi:hypothetical protein